MSKIIDAQDVFRKKTEPIKTSFYNILSTAPFKVVPLLAIHRSQRFFHRWNASWNALSVMVHSSLIAFSRVSACSKKDRTFEIARQTAMGARYCYWVYLAAGFDNKLPFALFCCEH
jgi:hypothetical protein